MPIVARFKGNYRLDKEKNTMNDTKQTTYLFGHTSPETAYVVDDYPWGFRLRTKVRYWIETNDKKNGGQRFAKQTMNPKNGTWCKPKYSTYSPIMIMFTDENGHVHGHSCDYYRQEDVLFFKENLLDKLDDYQKEKLRELVAYHNVMSKVKFEIVHVTSENREELKENKDKALKQINRAINHELTKVVL